MKNKKQLTHWLSVIVIGIALGFALQFVRAWTEPTMDPPNGNVGAPINTSTTTQTKAGGLNIGERIKVGDNANPATPGQIGQIRWNAGSNDFEGFNGTTWKSFTATGSGGVSTYDSGECFEIAYPNPDPPSFQNNSCVSYYAAYPSPSAAYPAFCNSGPGSGRCACQEGLNVFRGYSSLPNGTYGTYGTYVLRWTCQISN